MILNNKKIQNAIVALSEKYKYELEEIDSFGTDNDGVDEENNQANQFTAYNLAEIDIEKWDQLNVSNLSKFSDWSWDFREQGSPLYRDSTFVNWDILIPEASENIDKYSMLLTLIRALLFYMLPTNSMIRNIRSFNSVVSISKQLQILSKFLIKMNIYCGVDGNGVAKIVNDLPQQHFKEHLDGISKSVDRYHFVSHVMHWRYLSEGGLLPPFFELSFDVFSKNDLKKETKGFDESKGQYLPIRVETLSTMLPFAIEVVEEFGEDIIALYNLMYPVVAGGYVLVDSSFDWHEALCSMENIKTKLWNMDDFIDKKKSMSSRIRNQLCREIISLGHWKGSASEIYHLPVEELVILAESYGIEFYEYNKAVYYDLTIIKNAVKNISSLLRNAVAFIIFLVTGMRRSEFSNLESDSFTKVKGKDEYRLRVTVYKTSDMSQGEDHIIPIPKIAFDALVCLRELTGPARRYSGLSVLTVNFTNMFGKKMTLNAINQFFQRWSETLGVEHIHPHQFRKTIAMFAVYQDTLNLPIIKRLFGHKSLKMTLAYIVKMPGVSQEIKLSLIEQNKELLIELINSAESGVIGGIAGQRIKKNISENKLYSAMLNDDGWETLEQYIDTLLDDGVSLLHRAPLGVICIKTPSIEQSAPCDIDKSDKISRLHPDVQRCNATACQWSVFTENSIDKLKDEISFHQQLIGHPYSSESQLKFSQKRIDIATRFLNDLMKSKKSMSLRADSYPNQVI